VTGVSEEAAEHVASDPDPAERVVGDPDPAEQVAPVTEPSAPVSTSAGPEPSPEPSTTLPHPVPSPADLTQVFPSPADLAHAVPTPADLAHAVPTPAEVAHPATAVVTPAGAPQAASSDAHSWGRVDPDGTVWVRITGADGVEGERPVGSYPGASPDEALAYFARKYDDLAAQVALLEQRIAANQISGPDADAAVHRLIGAVAEANAVGDFAALSARLSALEPLAQAKRAEADQHRKAARAKAVAQRTAMVEEAEALAAVEPERLPWKTSGDRLRELFDQWRALQKESRLDKSTEDELWKRFSHARTLFDRKRRQHFGALDEQRGQARAAKEALVSQAEALAASTDWAAGSARFRDLMTQWKAAPRAARKDDDALWARFRAAQDTFFAARNAQVEVEDAGQRANLEVKEALLAEAEALVPVKDLAGARSALRGIQDRWEAAGKVPRADLGRLDGRLRAVEQAIKDAEQERWAKSNPQARARAQDAVDQLETVLAGLRTKREKALAAGNEKAAREAEQSIAAREEWLEQARAALADYGG